ncbi:MAG: FAD-binding protein [Betaproteobacteria bacterium]|nr:FAD-binding protein [Betaproteobacteria bacterium]
MTTAIPANARRYGIVDAGFIERLRAFAGERVITATAVLEQHGRDESYHPGHAPDAVIRVASTEEVSATLQLCSQHCIPVVPYGAGTSLEGHIAAVHGGVCIDLSTMDQVLHIRAPDLDASVQPGVSREALNRQLRDTGLFFPIDPGANATLGGMAATRASGTNAVRYGTMRENVLALTVVLPSGNVIRTGTRARKSSSGYDLTRLFVGSEGTLGVITELTVRLYGVPETISAAVVPFADVPGAVQAVIEVMQLGIPVSRIEFLDELMMQAINRYSKRTFPQRPTLFLEFGGMPAAVAEQVAAVRGICAEHGGADFQWASDAAERAQLWDARHKAAYAAMALRPGARNWATDVCVPISRLAECIALAREDAAKAPFPTMVVGHVGDGNFHLPMLVDGDAPAEVVAARALNDQVVRRALAMDGTCSGEHGIGLGKMEFLLAEHGSEAIGVMRAIKHALDPLCIMNPGKMFA